MKESILAQQGVSLDRLSTLMKIVDAGSIAKAAEFQTNKQSLFSRQMSELEKGLGLKLFRTEGRNKKVTFVGKQLASSAKAFLGAIEDLRGEVLDNPVPFKIGAGDAVNQWILFPNAAEIEAKFQFKSFEFHNLRTKEIINSVQSGSIDIGIVRKEEVPTGVESLFLRRLDFGLFYPASYDGPKSVKSILRAYHLISLSGEGEYTQSTRGLIESSGLDYKAWIHLDSLPMIVNAIKQFDAVSFLPMEAEPELTKAGFAFYQPREVLVLRRNYSLIYSPRSASVRTEIARMANVMAELIK